MTDDLVAFLRARLAEDEQIAASCSGDTWTVDGGSIIADHWTDQIVDWIYDDNAPHIARHDPARVLSEVEARRRITDECAWTSEAAVDTSAVAGLALMTLRLLALPYAGHPDYRDEWRP